jgi:hypothetical protein
MTRNDLPGLPPAESLAERFKVLMRAPGRRITIHEDHIVSIATDELDLSSGIRAACAILGVTSATVQGRELMVTLLRVA